MIDLSTDRSGNYSIGGTGATRTITLTLGDGAAFASGVLGAQDFPATLALAIPGYRTFGLGKPWDPLEQSTWEKK